MLEKLWWICYIRFGYTIPIFQFETNIIGYGYLMNNPKMAGQKQSKTEMQMWAKRLRAMRLGFAWSQRGLAQRWRCTHGAIRNWESGNHTVLGITTVLIEEFERKLEKADLG